MTNRKGRFLWICIFVVFILFILELNKGIVHYALNISNFIKSNVFDAKEYISNTFTKHTNQAKEIERLLIIAKEKEQNDILIQNLQRELNKAYTLSNINKKPSLPNVYLVEAYSYVKLGKYSQVRLKSDEFSSNDENKVFGLLRNGFVAGIALLKDDNLFGILNGDAKASYGVYIGKDKSVGILKTDLSGNVVIEYINAWSEIKEGDEVVTNGLDSIFFEGIKVGKVKAVRQEYGHIVTDVELYNKNNDIGYFWLINVPDGYKDYTNR